MLAFLLIFQGLASTAVTSADSLDNAPPESKSVPQSSEEDEPQTLTDIEQSTTLITDSQTEQIAKGVTFTTFERLDARGWINGEMLEVDISNSSVSTGVLQSGGVVSDAEPISEATNREGAIASVNGDFFDINGTKAPIGAEIHDGALIKGPNNGREMSAGVTTDDVGKLANILLEGTVSFHDQEHTLAALNQSSISENGIGLYNSLWGQASRSGVVNESGSVYEVMVEDGVVVNASNEISNEEIDENTLVLIGREEGASKLEELNIGDAVSVDYAPKMSEDGEFEFAIGGNPVLVKNDEVQNVDDQTLAPRTAVGFSQDGKTMYLVLVDGRQSSSRGMSLHEMGELMKEFGAYQALNLDGGGSSTMTARTPGEDEAEVKNNPSDGSERAVPNGIGIYTEEGNGELSKLRVSSMIEDETAYRVFPGLTRNFNAKGFDDAYDFVETDQVQWEAYPEEFGSFDDKGVFHASESGLALAKAKAGNVEGESRIQVLGELDKIEADKSRISLVSGETDSFSVKGYDENGYTAPIEVSEVELDYDESVIEIEENTNGGFTVTPEQDGSSTTITITVLNETFYIPVTIGFTEMNVSDFEDDSGWTFTKHPSDVGASMEVVEGREGNGIQLNYDFSTTTATRAAYLQASPDLELPADTQKMGLWVYGDGNGAWLRAVLRDASNTQHVLTLASEVDWTGWKYVETNIPDGIQSPLKLWRIYPVETSQAEQYTGQLIFDNLTVEVPPSTEMPEQEKADPDPLVLQNAEIGDERWRFAVISDTQFIAQNPDSEVMRRTRENLQQIVAQNPDFLVINGDFVDTGYPEDFELAKQVIDEEIGDSFPVYYIPGNHERTGTGNLDNFKEVFGESRHNFVHKGTQFIMLDSSAGSYRVSDFEQLVALQETLDEAVKNPEVRNVAVFSHHPTNDPLTTDNSQLSDRKEVALVEEWLANFRQMSGGKGAIFISSHASIFNVNRVDSVPYMVTGSAGKDPYGSPDNGGFLGWTMFGVENESSALRGIKNPAETDWIKAKVNPLLDEITMNAPDSVSVGESVEVEAIGHQPGDINIPLQYPASVNWSGSDNVFVGDTEESAAAIDSGDYDAVFDYTTSELTAVNQGEITLNVQSNNVESESGIVIQ